MLFLGLAVIILVSGCGTREANKKLVCTSIQNEEGMSIE